MMRRPRPSASARRVAFAGSLVALCLVTAAALAAPRRKPPKPSITFKPLARQILVGADATAAALPDGRVRIYWAGGEGIVSAVSRDGVHFTREPGTRLDMSVGGPHVRIMALPGGGWRLFFMKREAGGIGSATSTDGLNFSVDPGLRVTTVAAGVATKTLSTGDVVPIAGGRWRMYFSSFSLPPRPPEEAHEVVKSAVSSDLLHWTVERGQRIGGKTGLKGSGEHPAAVRLRDGSVALFYGRPLPFHEYVAVSRDGLTFRSEAPVVARVLDSAVVPRRDGSFLVYYGTYVPATNTSYMNVGRLVFHR